MLFVIRVHILVRARHFCSYSFHPNTNKNVRESNYMLCSCSLFGSFTTKNFSCDAST